MNQITTSQPKMTSREIAELTGKKHFHVMRDIKAMLAELGFPEEGYLQNWIQPQNGQTYQEFALYRELTDTLLTGYSVVARNKVIKRWHELERGKAATIPEPTKPSAIQPAKEYKALFGIAKLIGLDKNAAAVSANQAVMKLTGTNVLNLLGHVHLEAETQERALTPTELGKRLGDISGQRVNQLLEEAGLQVKIGEHWTPLEPAKGLYRLLDTGKRHMDGVMIQQLKWLESVLPLIKQAA